MSVDLNFKISDNKGDEGSFTINLPTGTSISDAIAFGQEAYPIIDALITGNLHDITVSIPIPGVTPSVPALTSDVREKAYAIFRTAGNFVKRLKIPTLSELKVLDGSAALDRSDMDVAAFETMMESGLDTAPSGGSGVISPSDSRDDDIVTLESAVEYLGR